jgi:Rod binding domain-containing protein
MNALAAASPAVPTTIMPGTIMPATPPAAARTTAQEFESFFVGNMLESMFANLAVDPVFGGGQGESVYRSLLLQEYGKAISQRGGFGVAEMVQREMLRMQEAK